MSARVGGGDPIGLAGPLDLGALAGDDRPYLVLNMVQSTDGRATLHGRAGPLGDPVDQHMLEWLRAQADAVLVGAGTVRVEGYGSLVDDPGLRRERRERGMPEQPRACVVSGRLRLDPSLPLLDNPDLDVIVLTASDATLGAARASVRYVRGEPREGRRVELRPLLGRLMADFGVRGIVCEGGPHLNVDLFREGLVDELFLTVSPKVVGGAPVLPVVAAESIGAEVELSLEGVVAAGDFAFLRYRVER